MEAEQKRKQQQDHDSYGADFDNRDLWELAGQENRYRLGFMRRRATVMAKLARLAPDSVILDVGCGTGNYTRYWLELPKRAYGLDLSSGMLKRAATKISTEQLALVQGDAESLPFRDYSFDALFSVNVIEHLDNIPIALEEMKRVCKNGGRVILSLPNQYPAKYKLFRLYDRLISRFQSGDKFGPPLPRTGAHNVPDRKVILNLVNETGIEFHGLIFMGFVHPRLSQIRWAQGLMAFLEKVMEKIPVVKSLAGVIIITGLVHKVR